MDFSMEIGEINVDIENDEKQQKAIEDKVGNEEVLNGAKKRATSQMNGGIKAKSPKMLFRCEICAADSIYHYYGVQSCEGCKQFFRRIIVKQKDFKCWKTQKCSIETGERCRSCRLDKCLLMGMDPKMVNIRKTAQLEKFIELLEKRRLSLIDEQRMGKLQQIRNEVDELEKMNASRPFAEIIKRASMSPTTQGLHSPASSSAHGASPNLMASPEIAAACSSASILQPIPIAATSTAFQPIPSLSLPNAPPSISFKMLDSLLTMENCLKKIWFSNSDLPNAYIERHPDLDSFLQENKNLLNQAAQFSANTISTILSPNFILEKAEAHGFHFPEHINSVVKDRFLCIEMAKAMPFFGKLKNEDQIALLRHIIGPVTMFFNAFYSFLLGSGTWTRSNGFVNIALFGQSRLANDNKIMTLSRQMLCDTVEAFKKADIGREEFVLLLAILFSSSTAPNLSPSARELLYDESVRHSKALLDLLQLKHGHICGSQKYAIAIELLTQSFHFDYRMHLLSTYTRVMHAFDDATIFPRLFEKTPLRDP